MLDSFSRNELKEATESPTIANSLIEKLPEKEQQIYTWLLDLCVTIVKERSTNKMTPNNLGIFVSKLYPLSKQ